MSLTAQPGELQGSWGYTEKACQNKNKTKQNNPVVLEPRVLGEKLVNLFAFWSGKLKCALVLKLESLFR